MTEIIHHIIGKNQKGGMGILAQHQPGDSFVTLTTEPCSMQDQYSKKTAVALLRMNMENGCSIRVPINPDARRKVTHRLLRDFVKSMFEA